MLRDLQSKEGIAIGRCQVETLMKRLRIEALYRKANTSKLNRPGFPGGSDS